MTAESGAPDAATGCRATGGAFAMTVTRALMIRRPDALRVLVEVEVDIMKTGEERRH